MKKIGIVLLLILGLTACDNMSIDKADNKSQEIVVVNEEEKDIEDNVTDNKEEVITNKNVEEEAIVDVKKVQVDVDVLNVRNGASRDSDKLSAVYLGSVFKVLDERIVENEKWLQVEYEDNMKGWIAAWFCSETELELMSFERDECPKFDFMDYYYLDEKLDYKNLLVDEDYKLYHNGLLVEEDVTFLKTGKHSFYYKSSDKQSPIFETQVISEDINVLYEAHSLDSEVLGLEMKSEENNYLEYYLLYDHDLELWAKTMIDDKEAYVMLLDHNRYSYDINTLNIMTKDQILVLDELGKYTSLETMGDQYFKVSRDGKHYLIHMTTGFLFEYEGYAEFINDDHLVVFQYNYDYYQMTKHELYNFRIVDLTNNNQVIYEYDGNFAYVKGSPNDHEDIFTKSFVIGSISRLPWYYTDGQVLEETVEFEYIDDQWILNVVESPLKNIEAETFTIYSQLLDLESQIGYGTSSDYDEIIFLNTFDIVDGRYVLWFELRSNDETKGYAFRPWRSYERMSHLASIPMHLAKDDGSTYDFEPYYDWMLSHRYFESGLETANSYLVYNYFEGKYTTIYPKDGSELGSAMDTDYIKFENSDKVIIHQWGYGDYYTDFSIHTIEDNKLSLEYQMPTGRYGLRDVFIIENDLITFMIITYNEQYQAVLRKVDGSWTLETDYEFEGEE